MSPDAPTPLILPSFKRTRQSLASTRATRDHLNNTSQEDLAAYLWARFASQLRGDYGGQPGHSPSQALLHTTAQVAR